MVGRQNADIADTLQLREVAMATNFGTALAANGLYSRPRIASAIAEDCSILVVLFFIYSFSFFPSTKFSTSLGRFSRNFGTRRGMC